MKLDLEDLAFPNRTVSRNWYRAQTPIHSLKLSYCDFTSIEPGAFETYAFSSLIDISFSNIPSFEYKSGLFNGLRRISEMYFNEVDIRQVNSGFLQPVQHTVNIIHISNTRMELDMNSLFGVHKFFNLERIHIDNQPDIYTLARSNFTGLRLIKNLMIVNSGLEVIMENAFDFIGFTLRSLRLSGNQLTTLPIGIFNVILEKNKYANTFDSVFMNNPWECDCEFLESLYVSSVFNSSKAGRKMICDSTSSEISSCMNLQILSREKLELPTIHPVFAYAKFLVKVVKDRALINSSTPRNYRLWIADHDGHMRFQIKNPKCPAYDWIAQSTRCHVSRTDHNGVVLPTNEVSRHKFRTICVNYIAFRQTLSFWPLHCVTYRLAGENMDYFWTMWPIITMIASSLVGAAAGSIAPLLYRRIRKPHGRAPALETNDMNKHYSGNGKITSQKSIDGHGHDDDDYDYVYCRPLPNAQTVKRSVSIVEEEQIYCGQPIYDRNRYLVLNP